MEHKSNSQPALISLQKYPGTELVTYLDSDKFVIGRSNESSLKILEKAISRKHCTIEKALNREWIITSHSRNALSINDLSVSTEKGERLKCGDKINLAGIRIFQFKCSPDTDQKCCCDSEEATAEGRRSTDKTSSATLSPLAASSSASLSQFTSASTHRGITLVDLSSPSPTDLNEQPASVGSPSVSGHSKDTDELSSKVKEVEDVLLKYAEDGINFDEHEDNRLVDELKENICQLKEVLEFVNIYGLKSKKPDMATPTVKKLFSFVKKWTPEIRVKREENSEERLKNIISRLDTLLAESGKLFTSILPTLDETNLATVSSKNDKVKEEKITPEKSNTDVGTSFSSSGEHDMDTSEVVLETSLKDELKDYKQNAEWQEARINYLEMKLKERDKLEKELETAKEGTDKLQNEIGTMRRELSKMQVLELEFQYLKEVTKYKEADKRNKDELEKQITILKNNETVLKGENEILASSRNSLEGDLSSWKQKCAELENKLKDRSSLVSGIFPRSAAGNSTSGEFCCDIRDKLLELLEKEFNCCICGDMYIEPTVTNCNHIFCSYCLREWKKKKKQCPFCRANLVKECRANVIDECITSLTKLISDSKYSERISLIEERKGVEGPPAKRGRRGNLRVAPVNTLMNHPNLPPYMPGQIPQQLALIGGPYQPNYAQVL